MNSLNEKFCLKFNDFQENTIKTFSTLREENEFFDVTLVSDDQKQIMAHKVVLSSCSEYFRNILKTNKHSHPMLCMTGITSIDLDNVLNYVYHGEVKIFQEDINKFLDIAQRLKLNGLLATEKKDEQQCHGNFSVKSDENEQTQIFDAPFPGKEQKESSYIASTISIPVNDSSSFDEIDQKVSEYVGKNENGKHMCNICGKIGGSLFNTKRHIETHLDGISLFCKICGKQFRSSNSLNFHKSRYHR